MTNKFIYTYALSATLLLAANTNKEIILEHNQNSNNPLDVILKVTNTSGKNTKIALSNFANEHGIIMKDLFTVLEDGVKIPYIGPTVLMMKPTRKTLKAYESYQSHVNLEEYYKVKPGTHIYEIYYGKQNNNSTNTLEIETTITKKNTPYAVYAQAVGVNTCSSSQMSTLRASLQDARTYALKAKNNLVNSPRSHALYQKWFGTATPDRYNTVYTNYSRIYNGLNQNVTYDCTVTNYCTGGAAAYVYKSQPYQLHICPIYLRQNAFMRAAMQVHEMSHFSNVADTIDGDGTVNQYGTPSHTGSGWAKNIAQTNPVAAMRNAYSYQYYVYELAQSKGNSGKDTSGGNNGGGTSGGSTSTLSYDFNNNGNVQGWKHRNINAYRPSNGMWLFHASSNDPQIISPKININADVIKTVTIRMANAFTSSYYSNLQLFWKSSNNGFSEYRSKIISITNHGGWTTYTLDMSNHPGWRGNISQIRIDPLTRGDGHWIGIDYIRLTR